MKRLLPRSLPGWILLVVVVALTVGQVTTLIIASREISETSHSLELYRLAERTAGLVKLASGAKPSERQPVLSGLVDSNLAIYTGQQPIVQRAIETDEELAEFEKLMLARLQPRFGIRDARIIERSSLRNGFTSPSSVSAASLGDGSVAKELSSVASDFAQSGSYAVSIQLQDGSWLNFSSSKSPEASLLTTNSLPLYMAVALALALLSLWAIRQLAAPYQRLEAAVREIGEDLYRPGLEESGFGDFRAAARAVNSMQRKLQQYVSDREYLAAALAHDLRTPITRMKLRCELLGKARDKSLLLADLSELERITQSVVDFATLNTIEENVERIDLVSLIDSVVDGSPRARIRFEQPTSGFLVVEARPTAVRRGLSNLVENAMRYADTANIQIAESETVVDIVVDDDGPGIPEEQLSNVVRPFYRLEDSRSRLTGGTGLGLAIVDEVARGHGGSLNLSNRTGGGLRAVLRLPRKSKLAGATAA